MKKFKIVTDGKVGKIGGMQSIILDLANGTRKPQNEKEEKLLKELNEMKKKGIMLDLPFD